MTKRFLVTGAAGFIGAALTRKLLKNGEQVFGIDNLNDYYDTSLKRARLLEIESANKANSWSFNQISIENKIDLDSIFKQAKPDIVVNLAAQAGVRYSLINPRSYIQSNLVGFSEILEACKKYNVEHLVYASSSSVYGGNQLLPFHESHQVNHPVSLYAATKKSNELMAHTYSHLYGIPSTGLRFFTVYGPWGRPDMAPMLFTKAIQSGKAIRVFNYGEMERDFTYIDDIVEGIFRCCYKPATRNNNVDPVNPYSEKSTAPHRIFNIGNSNPVKLIYFINLLEKYLGKESIKEYQPIQPGDVIATAADTSALESWVGFKPITNIEEGLERFVKWYLSYY